MEQYNRQTAGGYVQLPLTDKTVITELSGDFTLPDYQPEIKRLLRVTASVLPPSKYIGSNDAEFAGNIDYYVLYTGSDNEVYCAPLTAEYKIGVPVEAADGTALANMSGSAVITPDMISGRVTSPRKLSIKCRLRTRALIFGELPVEDGFGTEDGEVEVLHGNAEVSRTLWGTGEKLRVSDEMIGDSRDGDLRVISAEGKVLMSEVSAANGAVGCRGDLYLKFLMSREDGSVPYVTTRKIPFSQTVPTEGAHSGCTASAKGTVSDMSITVEDGRVGIDVGLIVEAEASKSENVGYVKDVYSTSRRAQCEYKTLTLPRTGVQFGGNFTLGDSLALDEAGIPVGAKAVDVCGSVCPEEYGFENGRCVISGKAKFGLLLEKDGEYSTADIELPFRYETKAAENTCGAICEAEVISARARIDGERVGIDAEIGVRGSTWGSSRENMLNSVSFGDEIRRAKGEYVICYPSREDTLWSVAKRYGAPFARLAEENGISRDSSPDSEESLNGVRYLMV